MLIFHSACAKCENAEMFHANCHFDLFHSNCTIHHHSAVISSKFKVIPNKIYSIIYISNQKPEVLNLSYNTSAISSISSIVFLVQTLFSISKWATHLYHFPFFGFNFFLERLLEMRAEMFERHWMFALLAL